jgi:hypothetical protein
MKTKRKTTPDDDLRPEYDLSKLKGAVRGKYLERYRKGTNLVRLDRDVAQAFPDEAAVNQALRAALKLSEAVRTKRQPSNKRIERTRG